MTKYSSRPIQLGELLNQHLRQSGIETPLLQRRLISKWPEVTGEQVAQYTEELFIKNQTLFVKISHAALRADLNMMRSQLVKRLNDSVGSMVIAEIKFY